MSRTKKVFSVSAINKYIHSMFDQDYLLRTVCVEGEISNLKRDQRGHMYFSIKDEAATLSCVMYAFKQQNGIKCQLSNGVKVIVSGKISVYEKNGTYQLYADIIEAAGVGDLAQRFEELKKSLAALGLFDASHKKPIPKYCKKIGVVTAATGAVIHDIVNVGSRRNPYVQFILCPSKVQGEGAAEEIAESIQILDGFGLDCIIVGRGGGSMEDLWAFNEEIVVRAVYECETPIISAVGHEVDTTLCDYAADLRAPTPSAAAELAVFDINETMAELSDMENRLVSCVFGRLNMEKLKLSNMENRLKSLHPQHTLALQRQRLGRCDELLKRDFSALLDDKRRSLSLNSERMQRDMENMLNRKRQQFVLLSQRIDSASPVKRLTGGYVYAVDECGRPLTSVGQVQYGDQIQVRTADGKIAASVEGASYLDRNHGE